MFFIFKLAVRNIRRNVKRTILTVLTVTIIVAIMVILPGYFAGIEDTWIENTVELSAGHVKIAHKKYLEQERALPIHFNVSRLDKVTEVVMKDPRVVNVNPRIRFGAQLEHSGITLDCLGTAINPAKDEANRKMKEYLVEGKYWEGEPKETGQGIIIGIRAAKELGVGVGDEVTVLARTVNFSPYLLVYKVRAIYESGIPSLDKNAFYITVVDAGDLLNMQNAATEVLVMIKDRTLANEVAVSIEQILNENNLNGDMAVLTWFEQSGMGDLLQTAEVFIVILLLIFGLVAALTILNTMLMAVFERTREIGMIRALGMKTGSVVALVIAESTVIAIIGGFFGCILGSSVSYFVFEKTGINISAAMENISGWFIEPIIRGNFEFTHPLYGFLFGIVLTAISSIYPAVKAARMRPVEALRVV